MDLTAVLLLSPRTSTSFATKWLWSIWTLANSAVPTRDFTDDCSSCVLCAKCVCCQPASSQGHTPPYMTLQWISLGKGSREVAELYSVKYCQYRPRKPAGAQWVYFFSSGEMPPLWIPPPLCVFLSQPPVVPWLLPWSSLDDEHRLLNGMRFTVHNALCSFNSLISIFCSALYYKSLNAGAQSLNVTKCPV